VRGFQFGGDFGQGSEIRGDDAAHEGTIYVLWQRLPVISVARSPRRAAMMPMTETTWQDLCEELAELLRPALAARSQPQAGQGGE
jgi:hypothetical protein